MGEILRGFAQITPYSGKKFHTPGATGGQGAKSTSTDAAGRWKAGPSAGFSEKLLEKSWKMAASSSASTWVGEPAGKR